MKKLLAFILVAAILCVMLASCTPASDHTLTTDPDYNGTTDVTENAEQDENPDDDTKRFTKMQSVLLVGQSNMAGRGQKEYVEPIFDYKIMMMRNGEWVEMQEPIHTDKKEAEIGLAASFAKAFVDTFDCEIGLVPAAYGGTTLGQWTKGYTGEGDMDLYETAIAMAKKAQETSEICAILWHQGESNRNGEGYVERFKQIMDDMIDDLNLDREKIVIITGELGAWSGKKVDPVNTALASIDMEGYFPKYGVASQSGLTNVERNGSDSHFDSPSLRVFGYRYFEIFYEELTGKDCPYTYSNNPDYYRIKSAS